MQKPDILRNLQPHEYGATLLRIHYPVFYKFYSNFIRQIQYKSYLWE